MLENSVNRRYFSQKMYRQKLLKKLYSYCPLNEEEQAAQKQTITFVESHKDCFERSCQEGHLTGSAWVENFDGTKFLLCYHKKLRNWVHLGGHPEPGEHDVLQIALREVKEESGLKNLICLDREIFNIVIHWFDVGKERPHFHFDICFLLKSIDPTEKIKVSDESEDVRWFSELPQNEHGVGDDNVFQMFKKWEQRKHRSTSDV